MSKTGLMIITDGSEEMEVIITVDVLRRAGVNVTIAGLTGSQPVKCSRNVVIVPDKSLADAKGVYDVVMLPGGLEGAKALCRSDDVKAILMEQEKSGRLIAAICAAPTALKSHGICLHKSLTSHPSKADEMKEGGKYKYSEDRVVVDGKLITSRAPGTAFEFALSIVEHLCGKEKVNEISPAMVLK
ncbi:Protein DJ-1-like protein [Leptotrombidium deliense]|uniref:Protein DJ-1-like protein n=1 Tax=Leptotrombidium deliense TaxID=299467 RepID=A0A443SJQ7_9ACAR|nr:Protein DJ-1-like protein [Leptotrombidium deliense]